MEETLLDSLMAVCKLLDKYSVNYLIIEGTAVALNGHYRHSTNVAGKLTEKPDIDIWYNPTYENYFNVLKVIEDLGQDVTEFRSEQSPNPRESFFRLDFDNFTFDILPSIKADIKFIEANQRRGIAEIHDTKIYYMNFTDLLKDKEATGRTKDVEDINQLKKRRDV